MSHVLHISVGPVQGFIAASRRTRDLRAGSQLLLEVMRAVAQTIQSVPGARLVFPVADEKGVVTDAANVAVAVVDADPAATAKACREAALKAFRKRWSEVRAFLASKNLGDDHFDFELAERQIDSFLEFHAGWAPMAGDYAAARAEAAAMMAASKALRAFGPAPAGKWGAGPKSPLDPTQESVIRSDSSRGIPESAESRLLLNPHESLDAVSLIKRFMFGDDGRYPAFESTRTVAVADLVAHGKDLPEYADLKAVLDELNQNGPRLDMGTVLFLIEDDIRRNFPDWDKDPLKDRARTARRAFLKTMGVSAPRGYFAVVLADGDGMGSFLGRLKTAEDHQKFSRALGAFAAECPDLAKKHQATHVYAGGDDVLALCPVSTSFMLARDLHDAFKAKMAGYGDEAPALSVAVAICPIGDDLRDGIAYAHELEKMKKRVVKDALIVGARVRSGTDRGAILKWASDPSKQIWGIQQAYREGTIPRGFAQDVCGLADSLDGIEGLDEKHLRAEFDRLLDKKMEGTKSPEHLLPVPCQTPGDLRLFGELLAVGHFLTREGEAA